MTDQEFSSRKTSASASAVARLDDAVRRISARETTLGAFRDLQPDAARGQAEKLDTLPPSARGPLHGLPVAVKEIFDVAGMRCTWGTAIHKDRVPAEDCPLVSRLKSAGALVAGTATSTEYAMAREPATVNPFDDLRTPGASSAGSAAAVGAELVPCALGSQTIGSCIRPASYCGVLGFKPSLGVLPTTGCMPLSSHLDHPGIFASRFDILEQVFDILADEPGDKPVGVAPKCSNIVCVAPWYDEPLHDSVSCALASASDLLSQLGYNVEQRDVTGLVANEASCVETILSHDMAAHHGADYDLASEEMSPFLRSWIEAGRRVDGRSYELALERRNAIIQSLTDWLSDDAVIITAATTGPAPRLSEGTGSRAPQRLWTLAGFPALAVPAGWAGHLPVGVQLVGKPGADRMLLSVGAELSRAIKAM